MVEEVSDQAEVRQSFSSLRSRTASVHRPALTVLVLGAAAVIVVVARHTLAKSLPVLAAASPGWLLLALAAEATGAPVNTVRSRVRLAREKLKQRIERDPELLDMLRGEA